MTIDVSKNSFADRFTAYASEFGWIWIVTAILFFISAWVVPGTVTSGALRSMIPFAAVLVVIVVGQTLVIQQRGLDLSVAALVGFGGVMSVKMVGYFDSLALGCLIAIGCAGIFGAINGILIAYFRIAPIVATLATNAIFFGLVRSVSGGMAASAPPTLTSMFSLTIFNVPLVAASAAVLVAAVALVLRYTPAGLRFVTVGSAPGAARAMGINEVRIKVLTYVMAAICFSAAGIILTSVVGSASHLTGPEYILPSIAAVVVGGTALSGGRGSILASAVGAIFMTQLDQMVLSLGAGTPGQLAVQAFAVIAATAVRQFASRGLSRKK